MDRAESFIRDQGGEDGPSEPDDGLATGRPRAHRKAHSTSRAELNWTIRTDDGATWLLESEAARELESLGPNEGQLVRVTYNGIGEPAYEVDLPWSPRDSASVVDAV